ncbi:MAG TPA: MobF family relaxase [Solirubrobacteraceae bacterium]|nr:MobF family relaxase [Solirubrobacteraceae bacterium]
MQTTHKISGSSAAGYAAYVTSPSDRGDYYTASAEGEPALLAPSRWHGSPDLLAGLGLSREREVTREELSALMHGVSPRDGHELRRAGGDGSRVAGIDMTFSAPKSVSALWAVSPPYERARIEAAHSKAVAGAIERTEREVELVRTRTAGELRWEKASSLLAAEFVHTSSRLTRDQEPGGVPDPQLHSHVVVLGAERSDGRFAAVDSRELFRAARANGAWYRAELAEGLRDLGLRIEGGTGKDGRYFEVAGVPERLAERWSMRGVEIERAARAFRTRYGRDPRAGELGSLTVATRGTKAELKAGEVDRAWKAVGEEHGLSREQAQNLYTGREREPFSHERFGRALPGKLTEHSATVSERDMRARTYELIAGQAHPSEADVAIRALTRSGELIALQGDRWTTRELRELELRTLQLATSRSSEAAAPVSETSLRQARLQVQREIRGQLSAEQREALRTITGPGGVSVLVGQAGTGKGVVIAAAAGAWQREGHQVIGTAVAGATAERLGADANLERSINTDALLAQVQSGGVHLDAKTVVVMDEAGMTDTKRLTALAEVTARAESKLVLVGDHAQLSAIGAGGMFAELQGKVPTAEVSEVHRARHAWEREAWRQVRAGEAHRALASYQAHGRLHVADTREEAAERMVEVWDRTRQERPDERLVMLTDASNAELDRINALAQERRAEAGELGARSVDLPDRPYGFAAGDQVIFTAALYQPGQPRVENGTLGNVIEVSGDDRVSIQTAGAQDREVRLEAEELGRLRLAYAQHLYKAQGRTVDRSFVLTGGWQTDREGAYVALTRAQEQTDIYVSREDLGEQGMDAGAIERLGEAMAESRAQETSLAALEREHPNDLTLETVADRDGHEIDASLDPPPYEL